MAGNARFHNKLHRRNHHSSPSTGYPDSGSDPIASLEEPFIGDFYLQGSLSARNNLTVDGNTLVKGNLSALGEFSYIDTVVSVTSALSVVNVGTGPALTVKQTGTQPIAIFLDDNDATLRLKDGLTVDMGYQAKASHTGSFVFSNNTNNRNSSSFGSNTFNVYASGGIYLYDSTVIGDPVSGSAVVITSAGFVGIGVTSPSELLTVAGNISALGNLSAANGYFSNNLTVNNNLSANNLTVSGNLSAIGGLSATRGFIFEDFVVSKGVSAMGNSFAQFLSSREITIVHSPTNDGINPALSIGEFTSNSTTLSAFSGYRLQYDESTNSLNLSSLNFTNAKQAISINSAGYTTTSILSVTTPNYFNLNVSTKAPLSGSALASDDNYHLIQGRTGVNTAPVSSYALHVRGGNIRVDGVDYSSVPGFDGTLYDTDGQSLFDLRSARVDANYSLSISESGLGQFLKLFGGRTSDQNPFVAVKKGSPIRFAQFNNFYGQGFAEIARIGGNSNVSIGLSADGGERLTVLGNISASGSTRTSEISTRGISLFHTPANDGTNPFFKIGELTPTSTTLSAFSGFQLEYNETLNALSLSSVFATSVGNTSLTINRAGAVTLFGSLSVLGSINNTEFEFGRAMPLDSNVYSVVSAGVWVSNNFNSATTVNCGAQDLFLTPIWIPTDCTVLSAAVLAGTGANPYDLRVVLYDATIDGRPNALVGNAVTINTGVVTPVAGDFLVGRAGFTIKRGNYYAGVMAKTNTAVLQTTFAGNIAKASGQLNFSGINRLLPSIKDIEGGHLIVSFGGTSDPSASLFSLPIDFTTAGGAGITTRVKFRQSAPYITFRISVG
jgi:hypothetical protein